MNQMRGVAVASGALVAMALSAAVARAADPVVDKPAGNTPVTVSQDAETFTLDNGIVKVVVSKKTGGTLQLFYKGQDLCGHDQGTVGGWETEPSAAAQVGGLTDSITIDPSKNNGDRAEVSIKGVTGGKVGLTPGSPGGARGGTMNMDEEVRWSLARGESGAHVYAIFSHPKEYGRLNVPEDRFIMRVNQDFNWISVDKDRNLLECAPKDWGTGVVVHAKEQRIMDQGNYKNSVEHKYSYTGVQFDCPAYGWSSTKDHVGVWFINPTIEYLSGGASKCELDVHLGDNDDPDPILLDYWRGTHYGGGASASINEGEEWTKVVGPIFIYVNSLSQPQPTTPEELATLKATQGNPTVPASWTANQTALFDDALAQAKKERAAWPYDWVNGVDYPHKDQRGTVTGQLVLDDPQAKTTKLPGLTVGLAYPDEPAPEGGAGGRGRGRGATGPEMLPDGTMLTAAAAPGRGRGGPGGAPGARGGRFGGRGGFGGFGFGARDYKHDAKHYQFWVTGTDDGKFTIADVRPGKYTLHAWADGVLGDFAKADITVEPGKSIDLGQLKWEPLRYGKQVWEIGYPNKTSREFFKGDGADYWLWGWPVRYGALFNKGDVNYTIGKSDPAKDWFFEEVPRQSAEQSVWANPDAKDVANQRFGWVKTFSLEQYPQNESKGTPWNLFGRGGPVTWTINFNMDHAPKGQATLRVALAGSDGGGGLAVGVNGKDVGTIRTASTNALRYNTDHGLWYQYAQAFDASQLKQGENHMTLTVPGGDLDSGVVWDYLRLELNEDAAPDAAQAPLR
ncbi:MAG TPA: polysaccharide lyase family protein [Phycisphaerae bacterium]|nr:polysaccharide lyase family protein [Phycisphaerae bacterium]